MIIWRSMPFKLHRNTCNLYKYTIQWNQVNHIFLIIFLSISDGSVGKESACNAGGPGSIPGSGRSSGEGKGYPLQYPRASLVAQLVKNPSVMQETWVQSLGLEDPLEKGKANPSSTLAWRIPHGVAKSRI